MKKQKIIIISLVVFFAIIFAILLTFTSLNFSLINPQYSKDAVWKNHNITFTAQHDFGVTKVLDVSKSSSKSVAVYGDTTDNRLFLSASGFGTGGSTNSYSTKICAEIKDLDVKDYSEIEFNGLVNLDSNFYKRDGTPAIFELSVEKGIFGSSLYSTAPRSNADGQTQQATQKIGGLKIKNTPNFWYVYDGAGTQLNLVEKGSDDSGTIFLCVTGGVNKVYSSTAQISFSDIKATKFPSNQITADVIANNSVQQSSSDTIIDDTPTDSKESTEKTTLWSRIFSPFINLYHKISRWFA